MMLIYKKLQIVELRTVINTAKVFAPLKKCNQQKKVTSNGKQLPILKFLTVLNENHV